MIKEKKSIIPKDFFSNIRNIVSSKEALKDVVPVNWDNVLKNRRNSKNQIIKFVKNK